MPTQLSHTTPVSRRLSLLEELGIHAGSPLPAYLALITLPFALLLGIALGHIPFAIWPQYQEGQSGAPVWLETLDTALALFPVAAVATFGFKSARSSVKAGRMSDWPPLVIFAGLGALLTGILIATLIGPK